MFIAIMEIAKIITENYSDMMPRLNIKDLRSFPIPPNPSVNLTNGFSVITDRFMMNRILCPWGIWQFLDCDSNSHCIGVHRTTLEKGLLRCNAKILLIADHEPRQFQCFVEHGRKTPSGLAEKKFQIGYRVTRWNDLIFNSETQPQLPIPSRQEHEDRVEEWNSFFFRYHHGSGRKT